VIQALKLGDSLDDTFTYTVTDGEDVSDPATVHITVWGRNDAPVVTLDGPALEYTEGDGAAAIAPDAIVTDVDSNDFGVNQGAPSFEPPTEVEIFTQQAEPATPPPPPPP
jgi:hypothetical protein